MRDDNNDRKRVVRTRRVALLNHGTTIAEEEVVHKICLALVLAYLRQLKEDVHDILSSGRNRRR